MIYLINKNLTSSGNAFNISKIITLTFIED